MLPLFRRYSGYLCRHKAYGARLTLDVDVVYVPCLPPPIFLQAPVSSDYRDLINIVPPRSHVRLSEDK